MSLHLDTFWVDSELLKKQRKPSKPVVLRTQPRGRHEGPTTVC